MAAHVAQKSRPAQCVAALAVQARCNSGARSTIPVLGSCTRPRATLSSDPAKLLMAHCTPTPQTCRSIAQWAPQARECVAQRGQRLRRPRSASTKYTTKCSPYPLKGPRK
eukprot:3329191-Lingulodinium_polyedra.AAC.1